ncbi:hypothetical protein NX059_009385 [Plenodomus lindquistii]|nr:hypothetical protein NX059_009385 [Plenodomus lindquistii]
MVKEAERVNAHLPTPHKHSSSPHPVLHRSSAANIVIPDLNSPAATHILSPHHLLDSHTPSTEKLFLSTPHTAITPTIAMGFRTVAKQALGYSPSFTSTLIRRDVKDLKSKVVAKVNKTFKRKVKTVRKVATAFEDDEVKGGGVAEEEEVDVVLALARGDFVESDVVDAVSPASQNDIVGSKEVKTAFASSRDTIIEPEAIGRIRSSPTETLVAPEDSILALDFPYKAVLEQLEKQASIFVAENEEVIETIQKTSQDTVHKSNHEALINTIANNSTIPELDFEEVIEAVQEIRHKPIQKDIIEAVTNDNIVVEPVMTAREPTSEVMNKTFVDNSINPVATATEVIQIMQETIDSPIPETLIETRDDDRLVAEIVRNARVAMQKVIADSSADEHNSYKTDLRKVMDTTREALKKSLMKPTGDTGNLAAGNAIAFDTVYSALGDNFKTTNTEVVQQNDHISSTIQQYRYFLGCSLVLEMARQYFTSSPSYETFGGGNRLSTDVAGRSVIFPESTVTNNVHISRVCDDVFDHTAFALNAWWKAIRQAFRDHVQMEIVAETLVRHVWSHKDLLEMLVQIRNPLARLHENDAAELQCKPQEPVFPELDTLLGVRELARHITLDVCLLVLLLLFTLLGFAVLQAQGHRLHH